MVFLKALGKWNLAKLSDSRFLGNLEYRRAVKNLYGQRMDFVSKTPGSIYIEANLGFYGLLDVIPAVFQHQRTIYIVRDGRDWIRSMLNWGEFYGKTGLRKYLSHKWPGASDLSDDPYAEEWDSFSRFEKLCWAWTRLNGYALETAKENLHARIFRFEELFLGNDKYQSLGELVTFATSLPGLDPKQIGKVDGWLERKIHQSSDGFPAWEKWTTTQKSQFEQICGPFMEELGYRLE